MIHNFWNFTKVIVRNKMVIFWTLLFPIVLATLFSFAFKNLATSEKFASFEIGIVKNSNYQKEVLFQNIISELSKEEELFIPIYYETIEGAKSALANNEISGYYVVEEKIKLYIANNGINQTIMKTVIDNYYETTRIVGNLYETNSHVVIKNIINELNKSGIYFHDVTNKNTDVTVIYFYTLIAMVCMYGAMYGMTIISNLEANLSKKGARISVAPTHKLKMITGSLLSGLLIQYVFGIILLIYMIFILKIDFGSNTIPLLFLMLIGTLAGVSFGVLVGVSTKKNENLKSAIMISIIMLGCFLSGMMVIDMKYLVAEYVPILAKINPVSVITDALYSLYYYTNLNRYFENIIYLLLFTGVMFFLSYFFLRRKKYDSI